MRTGLIFGGALLLATAVGANQANAEYSATARADLNIRSGPGPQFPVVGVIGRNDTATVIDCAGANPWCEVQHRGVIGWSSASYLVPAGVAQTGYLAVPARRAETVPPGGAVVRAYPQAGAVAGGAGGAVVGALVGGPVGAVVGGAVGAGIGAVNPPIEVRSYVTAHRVAPVRLDTEVTIGASLPAQAYVAAVPGYSYQYAYVNDVPVLVEPGTRRIVYVYR